MKRSAYPPVGKRLGTRLPPMLTMSTQLQTPQWPIRIAATVLEAEMRLGTTVCPHQKTIALPAKNRLLLTLCFWGANASISAH